MESTKGGSARSRAGVTQAFGWSTLGGTLGRRSQGPEPGPTKNQGLAPTNRSDSPHATEHGTTHGPDKRTHIRSASGDLEGRMGKATPLGLTGDATPVADRPTTRINWTRSHQIMATTAPFERGFIDQPPQRPSPTLVHRSPLLGFPFFPFLAACPSLPVFVASAFGSERIGGIRRIFRSL